MKHVYRYGLAGLFAAALALPATAIELNQESGILPDPDRRPADVQGLSTQPGAPQQVKGTLTDVDGITGVVALKSADGTLTLHFPPEALRELNKGDTITAQFAVAKGATGEKSTRAFDAPAGLGEHRMSGKITKLEPSTGWLHVKTDQTMLRLHFAPTALRNLQEGDMVTIDMAFTRGI